MCLLDVSGLGLGILSALFCFVSYGTLGWAYQWYKIESDFCESDYSYALGLFQLKQEIDIGNLHLIVYNMIIKYR